jgi:uncharacterized small protein (DUF1192 family)
MELPALKPTERDLAVTVANIRQGESATPRCEPPGEADIDIATAWVARVLKAQALYAARNTRATPAPDPEIEGLTAKLKEIAFDGPLDNAQCETVFEAASALTAMAGELLEVRAIGTALRKNADDLAAELKDEQYHNDELTAEVERWKLDALCLSEFAATYNRDTELQNLMSSNNDLLARVAELTAEIERMKGALERAKTSLSVIGYDTKTGGERDTMDGEVAREALEALAALTEDTSNG